MGKFNINIGDEKENETVVAKRVDAPKFGGYEQPKAPSKVKKIIGISAIALVVLLLILTVIGYLYWQNVKFQPSYSLALLVDAAKQNDQKTIDQVLDTDAVIDNFVPQVTEKAIEMYAKNSSPTDILKVQQQATPYLPQIKEYARQQVPALLREKTKPFENFPMWAIAIGASQYLDITIDGDKAYVKSKIPDSPLELTMRRKGDLWQIVAVKDDVLARKIAEKIGQEMINRAKNQTVDKEVINPTEKNSDNLDLKKKLEDLF
ncbi:hypothetical protein BH10ACI1_BH10ACI1_08810 [soil metagenome]